MLLAGFECGRVDLNGFLRLGAFLDALNEVNSNRILKDVGLSLGAVIIDSCSSDLRTVADLFELLSGTNIQKVPKTPPSLQRYAGIAVFPVLSMQNFRADVVALVRDDGSHLPNVDQLANHLHLPIVNTFFSTSPQPLTTGTLPSIGSVLEAAMGLLEHFKSTCVSVLHDELHDHSARILSELSIGRGVCLEQNIDLKRGSKSAVESALRRLLLTEARVVIVLLGDKNWINLMKALRSELVPLFVSSSISPQKAIQQLPLKQLTSKIASLPFPQHWLKQFWATAFQCHIDGETAAGQQFSKFGLLWFPRKLF
ncbi:unnamed protein product [Heligmosomoides polygyrus]|uniref:ANF_receptor domain-containing protein n=1 Tax=Heligmosomoides polygyrus TaxID=6339 RepID=A0A183F8V4_HELPZ|nr:unnamed protein product [Heligmosomoides polygyrus]